MQAETFPVLKALKGYKMATGVPETQASAWAQANEQAGIELVREVIDQSVGMDRHFVRQAAFRKLQVFATS